MKKMKFKKGDVVICLPGFTAMGYESNFGGYGYKEGKIFTIEKVERNIPSGKSILWPNADNGIFSDAVKLHIDRKDRIRNIPLLSNDDLKEIGFVSFPHFTIGNSVMYDLGRRRYLSASSIGTPNEFLYICEKSDKDDKVITDLICLHNYDYDGYLNIEKVKSLIELLKSKKQNG